MMQAAAVSLFAVGNGLGRLVAGPLSDLTHRRRTCPRPLWLCFATFIMAAAHGILFFSVLGAQYTSVSFGCRRGRVVIVETTRVVIVETTFLCTGKAGLYLGVFCVGCSFGSMFTLNVVISSELWGLRHHGERLRLFGALNWPASI